MKIYIMYQRDVSWRKHRLDTDLMLFEGSMHNMFQVKSLSDLSYIMENGLAIYVLREPMELGTFIKLEDVEFNIDFMINSSKILFIEPRDDKYSEALEEFQKKLGKGFIEQPGKPR